MYFCDEDSLDVENFIQKIIAQGTEKVEGN